MEPRMVPDRQNNPEQQQQQQMLEGSPFKIIKYIRERQ